MPIHTNQIRMVQIQKEADSKLAIAEANAKVALYRLLLICQDQSAKLVRSFLLWQFKALVRKRSSNTPIVPLQPIRNEGLEYARYLPALP